MRFRSKRRRLLFLVKILVVSSFLTSFYLLIRSLSKKSVSSIKIISKPKIYIVENEVNAFEIWDNLTAMNSHQSRSLINLNSHCNDGLYLLWRNNITNIIDKDDALITLMNIPLQNIYPAIAEFFNKITCIYPWWKHSSDVYVHQINYLGIYEKSLCLCILGNNQTLTNETICHMISRGPKRYISPDDCDQLGQQWNSFLMEDVYAQALSKDMSDVDQTMLSINLDFFTVNKVPDLPNTDIIEFLESQINALLCPNNVKEETPIGRWFRKLFRITKNESLIEVTQLVEYYKLSLCTKKEYTNKDRLNSLLSTILSLSNIQRRQLSSVGLCFLSTSRVFIQPRSLYLVICSGQLSRDVSFSRIIHPLMDSEIILQMEKLKRFLNQSVSMPHIITIVRSTRLGIVSPKSQNVLESLILEQLYSIYKLNETDLVFHPDLLGGVQGWFQRDVSFVD